MVVKAGLVSHRRPDGTPPVIASPRPADAEIAASDEGYIVSAHSPCTAEACEAGDGAPTAQDWLRYFAVEVHKLAYTIGGGGGEHALLLLSEQMVACAKEACGGNGSSSRRGG